MEAPQQISDGIVRLGSSKVNWYLAADESGVVIVDTGLPGFLPQLDPGLALLGRSREDVRAILLTHGDADHIGVAAKLQAEGDRTPIHLHPADRRLVQGESKDVEENLPLQFLRPGMWQLAAHFARNGSFGGEKLEPSAELSDGQTLELPGRPRVIHTPGHTEGHVVFHFPEHGAIFAGDSFCTWHAVSGERGPQPNAFNISTERAVDSLRRYEDIDADLVLFGHGEPWTDGPARAVELVRASAAGLKPVGA
jgi:glyoxylase-like metal-dependent hydrolase (beta-lactamase superfamily II)